ncbi:hypothetical protein ACJJTC_009984 [Scirpophaga incertulas]
MPTDTTVRHPVGNSACCRFDFRNTARFTMPTDTTMSPSGWHVADLTSENTARLPCRPLRDRSGRRGGETAPTVLKAGGEQTTAVHRRLLNRDDGSYLPQWTRLPPVPLHHDPDVSVLPSHEATSLVEGDDGSYLPQWTRLPPVPLHHDPDVSVLPSHETTSLVEGCYLRSVLDLRH